MKWNSRKFIYGILLITVAICIELLRPRGLSEVFAGFLAAIGATYFAGNVGEHYMESKKQVAVDPEADYSGDVAAGISEINLRIDTLVKEGTDTKVQYLKYLDGILKSQAFIIDKAGLGDKK